jgi:hypothetical protein
MAGTLSAQKYPAGQVVQVQDTAEPAGHHGNTLMVPLPAFAPVAMVALDTLGPTYPLPPPPPE